MKIFSYMSAEKLNSIATERISHSWVLYVSTSKWAILKVSILKPQALNASRDLHFSWKKNAVHV